MLQYLVTENIQGEVSRTCLCVRIVAAISDVFHIHPILHQAERLSLYYYLVIQHNLFNLLNIVKKIIRTHAHCYCNYNTAVRHDWLYLAFPGYKNNLYLAYLCLSGSV